MARLDSANLFPWSRIEDRTVDGQEVVFVPKVYVKNGVNNEGKKYWSISDRRKTGYHLHPAFMYDGEEAPNGLLVGKYLTVGTTAAPASAATGTPLLLNRDAARNAAENLGHGWHMYNVYEHHLLARLMLIEYGTADLQNQVGGSATASGSSYWGIADVWGAAASDGTFWLDGVDVLGTGNRLRVLDNLGKGEMVPVDVLYPSSGWVVDVFTDAGDDFDLGDLFIASTTTSVEGDATFGDYQSFGSGQGFCVGAYDDSQGGPFNMVATTPSLQRRFRLAKTC